MCMCVSVPVWVSACECRHLWRSEEVASSPEDGVAGASCRCSTLMWVLATKLRSSAQVALLTNELSLYLQQKLPFHYFSCFYLIVYVYECSAYVSLHHVYT